MPLSKTATDRLPLVLPKTRYTNVLCLRAQKAEVTRHAAPLATSYAHDRDQIPSTETCHAQTLPAFGRNGCVGVW